MNPCLNLIIVDDETYIRSNLEHLFPWEEMGIRVAALFANGQEALDYLEEHPVDLILTDIRMPVMDGITLAKICRDRNLPVTIVLLSAYTEFEFARSAMRYGVSAYLTKPVGYAELVSVFGRFTRNPKPMASTATDGVELLAEDDLSYQGYYEEITGRIKNYIADNIDTASLIGAAELTGLSPSYVSTIFHRSRNQTFSDYLTLVRMQEAMKLLESGTPVADAAWQVGYDNPRNFIRRFRQHFDKDPADCRPEA